MNILVIGSGGREHAFSWKIKQSQQCEELYILPGNAGTDQLGTNVNLNINDFEAIGKFVLENNINLVVVGPEEPLVKGITDYFQGNSDLSNTMIVGPKKSGALLEGSKDFSKHFMLKHEIPTAGSKTFTVDTLAEGLAYIDELPTPVVLKADGLAAGKGVIITESLEEAKTVLKDMLVGKKFGAASEKVVIEEFLSGIELSVFVLTDGEDYVVLPEAKDYKRIGENDEGPNTGGMGAVSPVPFADEVFMSKVEDQIIRPTINGLKKDGVDYCGFIFIGLMNVDGNPKVIEYNVRMGDPETQAVLPRVENDLVELLVAAATKTLGSEKIKISEKIATTVVLVSGGYPGSYAKGHQISGIETVNEANLFHAGTKSDEVQGVVSNGGRVLAITGLGTNVADTLAKTYQEVEKINWEAMNYRKDIGQDILRLGK